MHPSLPHLHAHHGDFDAFRDAMLGTAPTRFGPIWWGIWDQHVHPAPDATVVDLGCGPAWHFPDLRARVPDGRIIGVEVQPAMLAAAHDRATAARAEIVEADLSSPVPLPDGVADVVMAVHVLHELAWPVPLLAEIRRLLKPGGVLVLYDWVRYPLADYLGGEPPTREKIEHFREHCLFSMEDLQFLVTREGFTIREILGRRQGHYAIVVAERPA